MNSKFEKESLKKLFVPETASNGEDNGQITIIGGSELFHGAPLLSLTVASRIVDMVFFATPEKSVGSVAENIKSKLLSFIWIPWEDLEDYVKKSDAVLIGPGFMRFGSEKTPNGVRHVECDEACQLTKEITKNLLTKYPDKKWVVDAGSLQTMDPDWIPANSILTPNKKEFGILFGKMDPAVAAKKYNCIIVIKGPTTVVYSKEEIIEVHGGNPGLTKGGTGDVQAGLTVALLANNDPLLAASSAAYVVKAAADQLQKEKGVYYNADDLAAKIPEILKKSINE